MSNITVAKKQAKPMLGRPCSICTHDQRDAINKLIMGVTSFRNISRQFGMDTSSVSRHTENCLGLSTSLMLNAMKDAQGVDVVQEFRDLLMESKQALNAARKSLMVDGELSFSPRDWEITVAVEDLADLDPQGNAKRKLVSLDKLLAEVRQDGRYVPDHTFTKVVDCRKIYLETITKVESLTERFNRIASGTESQTDKAVRGYKLLDAARPLASDAERNQWVNMFAEAAGVNPSDIWDKIHGKKLLEEAG